MGYIIIDGITKFANRLIDALEKMQAVSNGEINTNEIFIVLLVYAIPLIVVVSIKPSKQPLE